MSKLLQSILIPNPLYENNGALKANSLASPRLYFRKFFIEVAI